MLKEFKAFILRGNVLDMAVGVVIGGAFTAIVTAFVTGVITPLVTLFTKVLANIFNHGQKIDVTSLNTKVSGVDFAFGDVLSAIITFLITGFVLFVVIKAVNKLNKTNKKEEAPKEATPTAEDYLKEIRDLLAQQEK